MTIQRRKSEAHSVVRVLLEVKCKLCNILACPGHNQKKSTEEKGAVDRDKRKSPLDLSN